MKFGLIFFSGDEKAQPEEKYRLAIESAKYADALGFSSIWIPERHFTPDGSLYPNPAVLQAALARETTQIGLRAGSVVMPLHHPIRVAEEWAMVDNLSNGRVGISFASGWHSSDFVFFPEKYADRREEMIRGIGAVQKLWRGEPITAVGGDGSPIEIRVFPTPIQSSLPIWLTAAGNSQTFERAGEIGANLLTHMFNQSYEELAERIELYRRSYANNRHPSKGGQVTLMLHTFVGDVEKVGGPQVRPRFCNYLKSASYLLDAIAASRGRKVDFTALSENDLGEYIEFVFDRLVANQRVLFGTPQECAETVARLAAIGVDEIACQIDFGVPTESTLASLPYLNQLKKLCESRGFSAETLTYTSNGRAGFSENGVSEGRLEIEGLTRHCSSETIEKILGRCSEKILVDDLRAGLRLGHDHRLGAIEAGQFIQRCESESLARLHFPSATDEAPGENRRLGRLALLDAAFDVILAAVASSGAGDNPYMLVGVQRLEIFDSPSGAVWAHARLASNVDALDAIEGDVRFLDDVGKLLAEIQGVKLRCMGVPFPATAHRPSEPASFESETKNRAVPCELDLEHESPEGRRRKIERYLLEKISEALRLPLKRIDPQEPINNLGIDSLAAVELKQQVDADLGIELRIVHFLLGYSIAELAVLILEQIEDAGTATSSPAASLVAEDLTLDVDSLTDSEVNRLLKAMLADKEVEH